MLLVWSKLSRPKSQKLPPIWNTFIGSRKNKLRVRKKIDNRLKAEVDYLKLMKDVYYSRHNRIYSRHGK